LLPSSLLNISPGQNSSGAANVFDLESKQQLTRELNKNSTRQLGKHGSARRSSHRVEPSFPVLINYAGSGKPDLVVDDLGHDEGIKYKGTFASMTRQTRKTLFQALITPDSMSHPLMLEL
jgi:hypothetical protein